MDKDVAWASVGDKGKGVKDDTLAFHGTNEDDVHSNYTDLDELCIFDDSSSEDDDVNVRKPKFLEFRASTDMKNPSFKAQEQGQSGVTAVGANTDGVIGLGAGATNVSSMRDKLAVKRNKMNAPATTQDSHSAGRA
ncbi:unnamed protein product [Ilex paraguariensis]|uniref:Uncharacterized protein n=1 Tax=Ilex paraguariensis TaxID=185542 RepID=A0ABC8RCF2_9AQUA